MYQQLRHKNKMKKMCQLFAFLFVLYSSRAFAQNLISEAQALELAMLHYPLIKMSEQKIEQQKALLPTAFHLPNTEILIQAPTGEDMRASILQLIDFPTVYLAQRASLLKLVSAAEAEAEVNRNLVRYQVKSVYNGLLFALEKEKTWKVYDSVLTDLLKVNEIRLKVGQISPLEKLNGDARYKLIRNQLLLARNERKKLQYQLALYLGKAGDSTYLPSGQFKKNDLVISSDLAAKNADQNPSVLFYQKQLEHSRAMLKVEKHRLLPGLMGGYFNQASPGTPLRLRFNYGITFPVAFWSYRARIKAAHAGIAIAQSQAEQVQSTLYSEYTKAVSQLSQYAQSVSYFETTGAEQASQIRLAASQSFKNGGINYYVYLSNIEQAFQIELSALEAIRNYNQAVMDVQYVTGE